MWRGVLHHICDQHAWEDEDTGVGCCDHGVLGEDRGGKAWLHPQEDAAVLEQLGSVILDDRLLQKADMFITNRLVAYYAL
jgi:hypothetical protein